MNSESIREAFVKLYGGEADTVRIFRTGKGIPLFGGSSAGVSVSVCITPEVYAVIRPTADGKISIQDSRDDRRFFCGTDELGNYGGSDRFRKIFHALEYFSADIHGAEIMLHRTAETCFFDTSLSACILGLGIISGKRTLRELALPPRLAQSELLNIAGEKNKLLLFDLTELNIQHGSMDFSEYKFILVRLSGQSKPYRHIALPSVSDSTLSALLENERKQAEAAAELRSVSELAEALRTSVSKPSAHKCALKQLLPLYEATAEISFCEAATIIPEASGIIALVKNENVDSFAEAACSVCSSRGIGGIEIYICETVTSGEI